MINVKLILIALSGILIMTSLMHQHVQAQHDTSMKDAEQLFTEMSEDFKVVNGMIKEVANTYVRFRDCVRGSDDVGRECQEYIDLFYDTAGIEVHDQIMAGKEFLEDLLFDFEESGVFQELVSAGNVLNHLGTTLSHASNVLKFTNQFNPEGARGDPTRGLNIIGSAIRGGANKLPAPMNRIFQGYADAVEGISDKLIALQGTINEARQGNLGGGFSMYAEAQSYFERHYEGRNGRTTIDFFDVSAYYRLLGPNIQVFQNYGGSVQEFYIYQYGSGIAREEGWLAPPIFDRVYYYFAALPDRSIIPVVYRAQLLVSQAGSNPDVFINEAKQHFQLLTDASIDMHSERLLEEMGLFDTMKGLLEHSEDSFVGFWLFSADQHRDIQRVVDALTLNVFVEGTVFRETETGRQPASNVIVSLDVEDGGHDQVSSDSEGKFFLYARGQKDSRFTLRAGTGDEAVEETSRFWQNGIYDVRLILQQEVKIPVSLRIIPEEAVLDSGDVVAFRVRAIFNDNSATDISELESTVWNIGSPVFTAEEPGIFNVSATWSGLSAVAAVTVRKTESRICGENQVWSDELMDCVCADGFEWLEELQRCVNIDEAIADITSEDFDQWCDEVYMDQKLIRLRDIAAESQLLAARFRMLNDNFTKVVNDKKGKACDEMALASAFSGSRQIAEQLRVLEELATTLSSELILEASICMPDDPAYDVGSIIRLVSQMGQPLNQVRQGLASMESQLMLYGCDEQKVADLGETFAEPTADPEIIAGIGPVVQPGNGDGFRPPGQSDGGTTVYLVVSYYAGEPITPVINVSVNFSFRSFEFNVGNDQERMQNAENTPVKAGEQFRINVHGTNLNPVITILESDLIWIDPNTRREVNPGQGISLLPIVVHVEYREQIWYAPDEPWGYFMQVVIGHLSEFPNRGREIWFPHY
ncbi:MAG: hypothetical protein EA391_13900 [Balneolaceae bacterium]|nr:MAG: hypothetical protein EA391_13900 [Balneolaceae bacterium]